MQSELGIGQRTTVVGYGAFLSGIERAKPYPDLLRTVFDFRHPSTRWSLPHANESFLALRLLTAVCAAVSCTTHSPCPLHGRLRRLIAVTSYKSNLSRRIRSRMHGSHM